MGLNIGTFNNNSIIDAQALTRVTEKILNPENQAVVDVSKLDLSKFNRVSLGTDLYGSRTNTETAIQAAKAATDFDVTLSSAFAANVQYLNSAAAQSLFITKGNLDKIVVPVENTEKTLMESAVQASSNVSETSSLNKDRRGANPFSFYMNQNEDEDGSDIEIIDTNPFTGLNIFA